MSQISTIWIMGRENFTQVKLCKIPLTKQNAVTLSNNPSVSLHIILEGFQVLEEIFQKHVTMPTEGVTLHYVIFNV